MPSVLVVDDSAVDRRIVGRILDSQEGWDVRYAVDGAEGLAALERVHLDVVVCDLIMPKIDGLQLVTEARERFPLVPVILMTSQGSEEIAVRALQRGAASYVPKRDIVSRLWETVRKVFSVSAAQRTQLRLKSCMIRNQSMFTLENDATLFTPLVAYLQDAGLQMGLWSDADRARVGVALEESLLNALYHGNLEIASSLRDRDDQQYCALVETRRRQRPYQDRRIEVTADMSPGKAVFVVRDEGPGFDPGSIPDPTDPANLTKPGGRGILLMKTFMDEITYNTAGNAVTLVKRRQGGG